MLIFKYFVWALRDCLGQLKQARHEDPELLSEKLLDDFIQSIKTVNFVLAYLKSLRIEL